MHISFNSQSSGGGSSKGLFNYLDKENDLRDKEAYEAYMNDEIDAYVEDESLREHNSFFSQEIDKEGKEMLYKQSEATDLIDNNRGSLKKEAANFYMMNVSPSKKELEHINKLTDKILEERGFTNEKLEILEQTQQGKLNLKNIRRDIKHQLLRDYARDIMKEYALNFNRKTYANPENLPDRKEYSTILNDTKKELKNLGITEKDNNYSELKQDIMERKAREIGKDLSKRNLDDRDILWFGKIEEQRTYKPNDKWVTANKEIYAQISKLDKIADAKKISDLENKLNRDRATGEIVREGMLKGGDQFHIHIIISRHEKLVQDNRLKQSLSPLANHKNGKVADKNIDVGFERDKFFQKAEIGFDKKFGYDRSLEEHYNFSKKKIGMSASVDRVGGKIYNEITKGIRQEIRKQSGYNEISKLNFKRNIESQLGMRIPLKLPTNSFDMAVKLTRSAINIVKGAGRGY